MTELSELLSLDPSNLAHRQAKAYAAHIERVLDAARESVRMVRLAKDGKPLLVLNVEPITFYSPGGDDAGSEDTCLDFSIPGLPNSPRGFGDAIVYLNRLIEAANAGQQ
jgi:hypothetical protein